MSNASFLNTNIPSNKILLDINTAVGKKWSEDHIYFQYKKYGEFRLDKSHIELTDDKDKPLIISTPFIKQGVVKAVLFSYYNENTDDYELELISSEIFEMDDIVLLDKTTVTKALLYMSTISDFQVKVNPNYSYYHQSTLEFFRSHPTIREMCYTEVTDLIIVQIGGVTINMYVDVYWVITNCSSGSSAPYNSILHDWNGEDTSEDSTGGTSDGDGDGSAGVNLVLEENCEEQINNHFKAYLENDVDIKFLCGESQDVVINRIISELCEGNPKIGFEDFENELKKYTHVNYQHLKESCPCAYEIFQDVHNTGNNNWLCEAFSAVNSNTNTFKQRFRVYTKESDLTSNGLKAENFGKIFNIKSGAASNNWSMMMWIPKNICGGNSEYNDHFSSDEQIPATFIHEMLHGFYQGLIRKEYPSTLPEDFYITTTNSQGKEIDVLNVKYWKNILEAYFDTDTELISQNDHAVFYQYFKNYINDAIYEINGQFGNKEDYWYYTHLIINTQNLKEKSPWASQLGIEDFNINNETLKTNWSKISSNFKLKCD